MTKHSAEHLLRKLKEAGVNDPRVDLFVAVFDNDIESVKDALFRGADKSVTDAWLLQHYAEKLKELGLV